MPYFHVVFTMPAPIAAIALQNKAVVYDILFRAAAETLRTIAADPKHLGAEIGMIAVLHTWGQNLDASSACALHRAGRRALARRQRWVACRPGFFLPVRVLSRLFRRLFLERLQRRLRRRGAALLRRPRRSRQAGGVRRATCGRCAGSNGSSTPSARSAGPEQVLDYLGRYTHRVAIANSRLLELDDGQVRFRWKDYRHHEPAARS